MIEGQEEVGSALNTYPQTHPEVFRSDAMLIADMGSVRPGVPTLTVALRGTAMPTVEVETLVGPKHSGQYGGAAPDALIVLLHALASLHDENGDVAVEGLRREEWTGAAYSEDEFRELAEVLPGPAAHRQRRPRLAGVVGPRDHGHGHRRAVGRQRAQRGLAARAREHQPPRPSRAGRRGGAGGARPPPRDVRPFGIELEVHAGAIGNGFSADTSGPAYAAARGAMEAVWGTAPSFAATGGSIPLVNALQAAVPEAEILLLGTTDGYANIHAPNERVLLDEFEKAIAVEAEFFGRFAETWTGASVVTETARPSGPPAGREDVPRARARRDRARRQQDAEPGDPVPLAVRGRDRAVAGAVLARRQGDLRGRQAAAGADRGVVLRRLEQPVDVGPTERVRAEATTGS